MKANRWFRVAVMLAVVAAATAGTMALLTEAQAAACRCPLLYAPVACDHGKVYPNKCVADCHNAKNCVPLPPI